MQGHKIRILISFTSTKQRKSETIKTLKDAVLIYYFCVPINYKQYKDQHLITT